MKAATLYELLDRLPERGDDFMVRFTLHDRSEWIQPECWCIDNDGDLLLELWNDDDNHDGYTVCDLKAILDDEDVYADLEVYVKDEEDDEYTGDIDETYYDVLDDRFEINWKRERVDVFMEYN